MAFQVWTPRLTLVMSLYITRFTGGRPPSSPSSAYALPSPASYALEVYKLTSVLPNICCDVVNKSVKTNFTQCVILLWIFVCFTVSRHGILSFKGGWVGKSLTTRRLNGGSVAFTLPFCHGPGFTCSCIQTGSATF